MVSRVGGAGHKSAISRRQLPITGSAHKARVVGDPQVAAVVAALDMATEDGGTQASIADMTFSSARLR